jgi:hypothetical protein
MPRSKHVWRAIAKMRWWSTIERGASEPIMGRAGLRVNGFGC